jgi:TonB family protein
VKRTGFLIVLTGVVAWPAPRADAQAVAGRLVDRVTRGVVTGVAVRLTDSANVAVAQAVSDTSGEFLFTLERPGRYRLYFSAGPTALGASELFDVGAEDFHQRLYLVDVMREESVYFEFQVTKQVSPMPGNPAPRYPPDLRERGVEGEVLLQFVVDTTGKPIPGTLRALRSTDPAFTYEVTRVVPLMRFRPAELADGRRVRQLVQMPFQFALTYPRSVPRGM